MTRLLNAAETLDREYGESRAQLIRLAASLDRIDRNEGSVAGDERMDEIERALSILVHEQGERAEQLQMLFSLPFDPDWRDHFNI